MDTIRNEKGFTLVELLVALSIFSIVIITITSFFNFGWSIWQRENLHVELKNEAMLVSERITRELRRASGDSLEVLNDGKELQFVYNTIIHKIYKESTSLYWEKDGIVTQLASRVKEITFKLGDNNEVKVELVMAGTQKGKEIQHRAEFSVKPRL